MSKNIYKTSEAIYHNTRNAFLKLFSFESVSQNLENNRITKRVRSVFGKSVAKTGCLQLSLITE
jgi:hypothetical protein